MLQDNELRRRLRDLEADNVERTESIVDKDKFGEAICAFGNDMPDRRQVGTLFVGSRMMGVALIPRSTSA